jgi:hypothetical protein
MGVIHPRSGTTMESSVGDVGGEFSRQNQARDRAMTARLLSENWLIMLCARALRIFARCSAARQCLGGKDESLAFGGRDSRLACHSWKGPPTGADAARCGRRSQVGGRVRLPEHPRPERAGVDASTRPC